MGTGTVLVVVDDEVVVVGTDEVGASVVDVEGTT